MNCTGLFDVEIAEPVWKSWGTWLSNRWMQLHDMLFDGMLWTDSYVQMLIGRHQVTFCRSFTQRRLLCVCGGGGGGGGTRPRYLIVCLWRRLLASRHCSF